MKPIENEATNTVFRGEGCEDLPVARARDRDGDFLATYWKPSPEELAMLNAGFAVRVCIRGNQIIPFWVDTDV